MPSGPGEAQDRFAASRCPARREDAAAQSNKSKGAGIWIAIE